MPAAGQDVRGIEICTVEKQIDRRTSCLQSNVDFLQSTLTKQTRETNEKLNASARSQEAANREIAALKDALAKLRSELDELKKAKPAEKKP